MKVAVVYWSQTGNTEAMANKVAEGARAAGAEVDLLTAAEFTSVDAYDAIAFGCPAMGSEELEGDEFEPMFTATEPKLANKKVGLFGSYGWGDGTWMREWEADCGKKSISLCAESVTCNETPSDADEENCRALGAVLAG